MLLYIQGPGYGKEYEIVEKAIFEGQNNDTLGAWIDLSDGDPLLRFL